jgi:uncharacterized protein (DUF362 family)
MTNQQERATVAMAKLPREDDSIEATRFSVETALMHLGGITRFVQKGSRVILKPNQTLFLPYTSGSTTSTHLMEVMIKMSFKAGAKEVCVVEAAGHAQSTRDVMDKTGMTAAARKAGALVIFVDEIAHGIYDFGEDAGPLRYMPAPEILDRADVIINLPKAKTHFVDPISCACKNWIGCIPMSLRLWLQRQVDPYYRANALFLRRFKPALTVVDGAIAGEGQGPGGNDPFWWGWTLASTDPVAIDVTVARLFGLDWQNIRMAREAANLGLGIYDPGRIDLVGAKFEEASYRVEPSDPRVDIFPCRVIVGEHGATIEGTLGHWKTIADGWNKQGLWRMFDLEGTPTFLFGDAEDPEFEEHVKTGPYIVMGDDALDKYKCDSRVTFVPGSPVPQSYMQNEMVAAFKLRTVYRTGLWGYKMFQKYIHK